MQNKSQNLIEITSVVEYTNLQQILFANGYTWPNKTKIVRQSVLNPATHMIIDDNKKHISRFFSLEQARNHMDHQRELHRTISVDTFLKGLNK